MSTEPCPPIDISRPKSAFLLLPRELRDEIYSYLIPSPSHIGSIVVSLKGHQEHLNICQRHAIIHVNYQIRAEVLTNIYKYYKTRFYLGTTDRRSAGANFKALFRGHKPFIQEIGFSLLAYQSDILWPTMFQGYFVLRDIVHALPALRTIIFALPRNDKEGYCERFENGCCLLHNKRTWWMFPRLAIKLLLEGVVDEVRLNYPNVFCGGDVSSLLIVEKRLELAKLPNEDSDSEENIWRELSSPTLVRHLESAGIIPECSPRIEKGPENRLTNVMKRVAIALVRK